MKHLALLAAALVTLGGCASLQWPRSGLLDVIDRPAERALLAGMRAYDDGLYSESEKQLQSALSANLASPRDRAAAHKLLAFIYCTSQRIPACEAAFRAARGSDPTFALSHAEAGHPLWGPVYKRTAP